MEAILKDVNQRRFVLRGDCPHCDRASAFLLATAVHVNATNPSLERWVAAMQCQGCMKYILAIVMHAPYNGNFLYEEHYPLGKPNDDVAEEIPDHVKPDFKEALRCRFVDAYNATAEMCRRAIEASCLDLGAPKRDVLEDMIDWLEAQRKITPFLKDVAHKIRLGGNRGAHPPEDGPAVVPLNLAAVAVEDGPIKIITMEHADAIIQLTREFFHHVYVVPKQLKKYDFSKPKAAKKP
jgi:Domain of unknown function (DUF4145)